VKLPFPGTAPWKSTVPTDRPLIATLTECGTSVMPWSATSSRAPVAPRSRPSRVNVLCRGWMKTAGPKNFSASPFSAAPNQVSRSRISEAARKVATFASPMPGGVVGISRGAPSPAVSQYTALPEYRVSIPYP
jgi:hypothetical protein